MSYIKISELESELIYEYFYKTVFYKTVVLYSIYIINVFCLQISEI